MKIMTILIICLLLPSMALAEYEGEKCLWLKNLLLPVGVVIEASYFLIDGFLYNAFGIEITWAAVDNPPMDEPLPYVRN
jgi:hypothetical protein